MSRQKNLKRNLLICLLAGSAVMYTLPLHAATSVVANTALPGNILNQVGGVVVDRDNINHIMDITQTEHNAFIKWDKFDVGGSATVNFWGPDKHNTLNYVNSGGMSQIYGTINANNNGNIFIVNPAGVQIGNSAQINVGSLYVSNKNLDEADFSKIDINTNVNDFLQKYNTITNAELMSLGNINATNVTFEGDGRIVIDSERLINGDDPMGAANINIKTAENNIGNIVIGYDGYNETTDSYYTAGPTAIAKVNGQDFAQNKGYMWVEDVEQLQAIGKNAESLTGNYALRNSIDATSTEQNGFKAIGSHNDAFKGKFDGIDYNIFGLNIDNLGRDNAGLFGVTDSAVINNVTLVGGKITGGSDVGAIVGEATNGTQINNVINSAVVSGDAEVGGIVGSLINSTVTNAVNTGTVTSKGETDIAEGVTASNAGGLIGHMNNGKLLGDSYNLGAVTGQEANVGGLVGYAVNSIIGDGTNLVYNRLDVTGKYNVGGIVGNMGGTTVQNAENSGNVTATSFDVYGSYTYHSAQYHDEKTEKVNVANVGGIAGKADDTVKTDDKKSVIKNVTNSGNVSSSSDKESQKFTNGNTYEYEYYTAGNVGGIVGSAVDTNITNATNRENEVRGAHNVGGVAGYFGGSGKITTGINDGGDIMATGARNASGFVKETVRPVEGGADESFIIGNIGGIVGYLDGDDVFVTASGNRGTVHTQDIAEANKDEVLNISKAANVGGVVGKIDRDGTDDLKDDEGNLDITKSAVSNSYNTGDVRGYTGVGGVVGMMYNGEVASSYNLGYISTTRQSTTGGSIDALNMGGVVGDTTELSGAEVYLYDVYNKGQIGDKEYNYFGRHVGGVVGRLSGTVEKAYNNGAIYNGYNVVGGIAGWMAQGKIENAFNTGNITVLNRNDATSQVGGIVGAASDNYGVTINNAYNLGTLRSFKDNNVVGAGNSTLGGIIGHIQDENKGNNYINITNVYTTGNLYVDNGTIGSIYGNNTIDDRLNVENTYYIRPDKNLVDKQYFTDLYNQNNPTGDKDNSNKAIAFDQKSDINQYQYGSGNDHHSLTFTQQSGGNVDGGKYDNGQDSVQVSDDNWRIYAGNTPILNAFLPNAENYFSQTGNMEGISSIQYGTAYDPLLTIINAANGTNNLSYNWSDLGISSAAGIAVYGAGLTLKDITTSGGTGYFGGTIYADGALNLNSNSNIGLGSAAQIYGSAVNIDTDGKVTIYGDVTATGNIANGATVNETDKITVNNAGNISINAGDVDVYGTLTTGKNVSVPGIEDQAVNTWTPGDVDNPYAEMVDIADRFAHETTNSNVKGDITITANGTADGSGNVNLYFGNKEEGLITTGGNLTVTGEGDVYVDSDLAIGGNLTLTGNGANSEVVLDLTNIGQVQADNGTVTGLNNFLNHFAKNGKNTISFGNTQNAKITVDMWNGNTLNLDKFGNDFTGKLNALNIIESNGKKAQQLTHIWVNNGEQLKGIQEAADTNSDILGYNFALKGDINASDVTDYEAIGGTTGFTGTFDGRGNRIIGLDTTKGSNGNDNTLTNAGIFSTIGEGGTVKNVNIYSGNFEGTNTAGAVAGENNGRIENVTGFGNTVTVTDEKGNAGGIVGVNNGKGNIVTNEDGTITLEPAENEQFATGIIDVESIGSVIAEGNNAVAGGLVGTNEGALGNSYSDSAVTSTFANNQAGLGGVVGVNTENGDVQYVDSLGVTNGGTSSSSNVGGIIGVNNGNMYSGYNESIVSGNDYVGGIIGQNTGKYENDKWNGGTVENVVNATGVTGSSNYVGGLVGTNTGSVTNGRNNGTITGNNYVGGLVGDNANANSILTNLVNDSSAEILGEEYVGGIAGKNSGTISATNDGLTNRGSITGQKYVGGVAGLNTGSITNTNNDVSLNVKNENAEGVNAAEYFGGVVGRNQGTINSATNSADITANGATYVGGIAGYNDGQGVLVGMGNSNEGNVVGKDFVGGVIGRNEGNIGTTDSTVKIVNSGQVTATDGGAGGLIAYNAGDLTNVEMTNAGLVKGTGSSGASGTGGLIGYNEGDITGSVLENTVGFVIDDETFDGDVTGLNNVGGVIGVNTGKIENTSLMNKADITVTVGENQNAENIGGLIGKNIGEIEGGRDAADSYYKYQIYNNGTITVTGKGENIGGLIGNNTGSLTAGYNTGAINASGSENVGGIAGTNSGKLDQVFNTVMVNPDDAEQAAAITGGTNVGGLVGANSGTLSNAYNTTGVSGTTNGGNAVGVNNANGTIENIYASNISGNLIGDNNNTSENAIQNAYSFVTDDTTATNVISGNDQKDSDSYNGFDFDSTGATKDSETAASDGTEDYWKIYSGSGNPLLKVFLTTVTVDTDNLPNLVYNTKDQDLIIGSLIGENGAFSAADDFKAYQNNNSLIQNTGFEHKNAGTYDNWLYSQQIAETSSNESFNPNNLGYDIEFEADIDKAQITIDLNQVDRVYGDTDIVNGEYGFSYGFNNVLSDKDKTALGNELKNNNALNMNTVNTATDDTGLIENGTKTNDAGIHSWTGTVNIADDYKGNYEFVVKDSGIISNNGATITTTGKSVVNQRKLSVSDIVASIVYGNQDGKGFIVSGGELIGVNGNDGIVYGDNVELNTTLKVEDANIIADSSYASNKGDRVTADADKYENSLNFSGLDLSGDDANNYVLVNDSFGGTIKVTQATINVDLNDVDRTYGSAAFNGNGYGISNVQNNANGDTYTTGDFVVNVDTGDDGALTGDNSGRVTNDVGNYTYIGTVTSNNEKLNQNYNIVVNNSGKDNNIGSGLSTVSKAALSITINGVDTTYGTAFDESQYGYTLDKLVNGDGNNNSVMNAIENAINNASGGYHNTGAADGTNGKVTQDAEGDYSLSFKNDITQKDVLTNYNITVVKDGKSTVNKAQIAIGANNEEIHLGERPDYTGKDINSVLVNGDKLNGNYHYGVKDSADEKVVGNHSIGVWIGNTFYDLSATVDWTKVDGFFSNYKVTYNPGTLTVTEQIMPDLPDNWPNNRWDYLFGDNPFDRNENFRERKAEVNFVDGVMEI